MKPNEHNECTQPEQDAEEQPALVERPPLLEAQSSHAEERIQLAESRYQEAEARSCEAEERYRQAMRRARLQAGLAFTALVLSIVLLPGNRAAIAEASGSTLQPSANKIAALQGPDKSPQFGRSAGSGPHRGIHTVVNFRSP